MMTATFMILCPGIFLIVGLGEEDFTDLSPDLMEKYGEQFKYPEKFARIAARSLQSSSLQPMNTGKTDDAPFRPGFVERKEPNYVNGSK